MQRRVQDALRRSRGWGSDAVVHPFALASRCNESGASQIGEVAGNLWLAFAQDTGEVADADFAVCHQIQKAQAGFVRQSAEDSVWPNGFAPAVHGNIIYALANIYSVAIQRCFSHAQ